MAFSITEDCKGCGVCKKRCPWDAVQGEKKQRHQIVLSLCRECSTCWYICPRFAIEDPEGYRRAKGGRPMAPKACIDREACVGCQNCLLNCEQEAVHFSSSMLGGQCQVDDARCVACGNCLAFCAGSCISIGVSSERNGT
jgi:MinD superfamily P-loop ATPase